VDVDVGIAVAVSVGGGGVWVAVSEGVTGIKVAGSVVDTDESKQPTRDSNSHIKRNLDKGRRLRYIIFVMEMRKDLFD
jgi:hypothetical protein